MSTATLQGYADQLFRALDQTPRTLRELKKRGGVPTWAAGKVLEILIRTHRVLVIPPEISAEHITTYRRHLPGDAPPVTLDTLVSLVWREAEHTRARLLELQQTPVELLVGEGRAIIDLQPISLAATTLQVRVPAHHSRFREGDLLSLHQGFRHCPVYLVGEEGSVLTLASVGSSLPAWAAEGPLELREGGLNLGKPLVGGLRRTCFPSLRRVLGQINGQARRIEAVVPPDPFVKGLDPSQRHALVHALGSEPVGLVQGPPGTGKTEVLARAAAALARQGKVVLVSAFTHRAVNHALSAIHRVAPEACLVKVGEAIRAAGLPPEVERVRRVRDLGLLEGEGPWVVGMTSHQAVMHLRGLAEADPLPFDHVLVDEASQLDLALGVGLLSRAPRATLFGDHRQMAPVLQAEPAEPSHRRSVFEALWERTPGVMLETSYRMSRALVEPSSLAFYGGRVVAAPGNASRGLPVRTVGADLPPADDLVLLCDPADQATLTSPAEAEALALLARRLVRAGLPPQDLAAVAVSRLQVRCLRQALQAEGLSGILVDTVERLQGQEREAVLVSLSSNEWGSERDQRQILSDRRLNVALTRARSFRAVAMSHTLALAQDPPEVMRLLLQGALVLGP